MDIVLSETLKNLCELRDPSAQIEPDHLAPSATAVETPSLQEGRSEDDLLHGLQSLRLEELTSPVIDGRASFEESDDGDFVAHGRYSFDYAEEFDKDYTACSSSDCGWCGHCDY